MPSPGRPSARVHRQELTFPGEPGVGRKTVALFLLFCTLFPGIGAGARPGSDQVMSCGLSLSVCTFPCRSCLGIREGTVQGMTSGCASSLRAAPFRADPFGAAHSGLPHFEMPQQPENALHLCCHSSALVPCALRGSSAGSARCFTPGSRRFLLCPAFQERSIIVGLMGQQYSGAPDPKILSFPLRESPRFVRRHAALVSDMEKEIPDLCLGYGCCGTGRNCNPDSAGLPVFRLIMEGPGCGPGS